MAEGFRFLPLGLVRLRTFRLSTWVTYINTGVHARSHRADTSLRGVTIDRNGKRGRARANDVTHRKRAEDFGNLKTVKRVENWTPNETVDFRLFAEARPVAFVAGAARDGRGGADEKARKERLCLSLSLYRRTFKLKSNKKFRT